MQLLTHSAEGLPTDPATWTTYDGALQGFKTAKYGIGFIFNGDGLIGVDIDDCRNPKTDKIAEWAQQIIDSLTSYCEVSPSGTGVKIFVRGVLPDKARCEYPRPEGEPVRLRFFGLVDTSR